MNELISFKDGKLTTTSLLVAEKFGKLHKDVLRSIEALDCSSEFTERNFALSEYIDDSGKANKFFEITRDGFSFLAMGFTGKRAAQWKETYINAFNLMEQEVLNIRVAAKVDYYAERNEVSAHQLRIYLTLKAYRGRWLTTQELAVLAKVSVRTARFFCKYYLGNGIVDMIESFPAHHYQFSEMAEKRNPQLIARLETVGKALGCKKQMVRLNIVPIN